MSHHEKHRAHRVGWLRAGVLGANDGIVSTASLIIGVAAANTTQEDILLAGVAGLVAGAMSMAAGEYVSVKSQADTEEADLSMEARELECNPEKEQAELKSYCLSFSAAYHLSDSTWMVFDELVRNSPLAEIPNKILFLKSNPYYETSDENYLYYLRVVQYRISDNISPMEFVKDDIRNIILNKRKVQLAKELEDEVYKYAMEQHEFEIYNCTC